MNNVIRIDRHAGKLQGDPRRASAKSKADRILAKAERQRTQLVKVASTFGIKSKDIYRMVDSGNTDQAIVDFQRHMFATLMRLIPIAEAEYRKHRRESQAYAMNSLISQARELTSDIKANSDRTGLASKLLEEILKPSFQQCLQEMVNSHFTLKSRLRTMCKDSDRVDDTVDACVQKIAEYMNEVFKSTVTSVNQVLVK